MSKNLLLLMSVILLVSCSAMEHDDEVLPVDSNGMPNLTGDSGGAYEGTYSGTTALVKNECLSEGAKVAMPAEMTADVLQSGNIINIQFNGEGQEATGDLKDSNVVLIYKEATLSKIYRLTFTEDGITGVCEISETTASGSLGNVCAQYSIELLPAE